MEKHGNVFSSVIGRAGACSPKRRHWLAENDTWHKAQSNTTAVDRFIFHNKIKKTKLKPITTDLNLETITKLWQKTCESALTSIFSIYSMVIRSDEKLGRSSSLSQAHAQVALSLLGLAVPFRCPRILRGVACYEITMSVTENKAAPITCSGLKTTQKAPTHSDSQPQTFWHTLMLFFY